MRIAAWITNVDRWNSQTLLMHINHGFTFENSGKRRRMNMVFVCYILQCEYVSDT